MVNLFNYLNYRSYLKDIYEDKKKTSYISYRAFAKVAGISHNTLKLVIDGKRNLTSKTIKKFITGLKLTKNYADYFAHLVIMNQATDPEEKKIHYEKLLTFKSIQKIHTIEKDIYKFLSKWYIIAVHELVSLPNFIADPTWISKELRPQITVSEAKEALDTLVHIKLIKINSKTLQAKHTKGIMETPPEIAGYAFLGYYNDVLSIAKNAVLKYPTKDREMSSITMALSKKQFKEAKEMIKNFRRDFQARFPAEKDACGVYQFNVQFFPISEVRNE